MKVVALLRALNVGGNNRIKMADLRANLTALGHPEAQTIGATGVVLLDQHDSESIGALVQAACRPLEPEVAVLTMAQITEAAANAPTWWQTDAAWRHNLIFMIGELQATEFLEHVQMARVDPVNEKIVIHDNVVFWSSAFEQRAHYYRSEYAKLLQNPYYKQITIRNANTLTKIVQKFRE